MSNPENRRTERRQAGPGGPRARIDYRIEGRILRTLAAGPFNDELVSAIPRSINDLLVKLIQQGKWGQIITFERSAVTSQAALSEFTAYLQLRYLSPETRPATALVIGHDIEGALTMAPLFQRCYQSAGIECNVFEDYSTAHYWVKSKIRQISSLIEWNDSYKVGDAMIDEQHHELFLRAGDIIAATNPEGQTVGAMRLYQYARAHFSHEESEMRRTHYPDIALHLAQHDALIKRLQQFVQHISQGDLIKAELEDFVAQWFLGHIANLDSKLAAHLKA